MKLLSAADIVKAPDFDTVDVPVPEWGADAGVRLRSLSGDQILEFIEYSTGAKGPEQAAKLLVLSAVNEDGSQMFTSESLEALRKKSFKVVRRLQEAAMILNGLATDDTEKKRLEAEAKNA